MPAVPSLALGTGEVSLLNLTSAYTAFANGGVLQPPVTRAARRGRRRPRDLSRRIGGPPRAERIDGVPDGVDARGRRQSRHRLLARARAASGCRPAARPARTDDHADAWFIGFTPRLAAGVWVGFDRPAADHAPRFRERRRRAGLGGLHEGRDHAATSPSGCSRPSGIIAHPPLPRVRRPRHRILRADRRGRRRLRRDRPRSRALHAPLIDRRHRHAGCAVSADDVDLVQPSARRSTSTWCAPAPVAPVATVALRLSPSS